WTSVWKFVCSSRRCTASGYLSERFSSVVRRDCGSRSLSDSKNDERSFDLSSALIQRSVMRSNNGSLNSGLFHQRACTIASERRALSHNTSVGGGGHSLGGWQSPLSSNKITADCASSLTAVA